MSFRSLYRVLPAVAVAAFACLLSAQAKVGDKVSWPSFSDNHIAGDKITADDLLGKVVFFEYWGVNCPPCRAAMPHLVDLQKKYGSKGFTVIGSHCQMPGAQVSQYVKEAKLNFPVYQFKTLAEAPCKGGLPYSVLVGANGRVVAEGLPGDLYDKVSSEVAKAANGYPILDGVELKKYKSLAKTVTNKGSNIEAKITPLREAAANGDSEAESVCKAFDEWLDIERARISNQWKSHPLQAVKSVSKLKKTVPSVKDFDEQAQAFTKSEAYPKLVEAQKKINTLQKTQAKGRSVNASTVKNLSDGLEKLRDSGGEGVDAACNDLLSQLSEFSSSGSSKSSRSGN